MCVVHLFRDSVKVRYGRLSEVGKQPRFSDTLVSILKLGLRHIYIYIYIYIYISHALVEFEMEDVHQNVFGKF